MADISKINGYELKDAVARQDIAGMKDGTITVKEASHASIATTASSASHAESATSAKSASNYAADGAIAGKI